MLLSFFKTYNKTTGKIQNTITFMMVLGENFNCRDSKNTVIHDTLNCLVLSKTFLNCVRNRVHTFQCLTC